MKSKIKRSEKVIIYHIEYRVEVRDSSNLDEILDKMAETGSAEIIDVEVEEKEPTL